MPNITRAVDDLELNRVDKLEETLEMLKRMVAVFEDDGTIERNFEGLIALSNPKYSLYIERPDATVAKKFSDEDVLLGQIQRRAASVPRRIAHRVRDCRAARRFPSRPCVATSDDLPKRG